MVAYGFIAQFATTGARNDGRCNLNTQLGDVMARVGIDLDGVCYDFAASLRQYIHKSYGTPGPDRAESATDCSNCMKRNPNPQRWEFYKDWGLTTDQFQRKVRAGVDAGIVFLWGPAHKGTKEALEALNVAGHELIIVTDRLVLGGSHAEQNTLDWLLREELPYEELHFDADKTAYNCDYFVDDKLENYDALDAAGVKVYLWDRPWNQDDSKERRRVSSWDEFLEAISWGEGSWVQVEPTDRVTEYLTLTGIDLKVPDLDGEVRITSPTGGQKGRKLARFGLIPKGALRKVAEVYGKGAEKYEDWNWRKGYDWDLSLDALHRHLADWEEGKSYHEDGHSLASVVFHALTLMTFEEEHPEFDTRFKKSEDAA